MLGIAEDAFGLPVFYDLAEIHYVYAVGEVAHNR
jgi:hypothetical protein